ncbi:GGDEF domain-containing protein [Conexibacter woesei]|uniref:GGDEF domain-containing protein n=1 Tax=Conexibacter woesei TaxID=191495 RepID=UPI0003FE56F6|nr:GGDEF domain-containing protein [Conexibacter woesei]
MALTLFGVGSTVCAAGAVLKPDLTDTARQVQLIGAGGTALCGLAVWLLPPWRWVVHVGAMISIVMLGLLMGSSNAIGATPFFFLWPLVHLAYFARRAVVATGFAVLTTTVTVAVAVNPYATNRADTIIGTVLSVGLMTGLVMVMTARERELQAALARAADTDALTGVLNRRGLAPLVEALVARASAGDGTLAVVMVDLDHFKRFNDRHGHLVGDEALIRLAGALTAAARDGDHVARVGGEEFTVALPGADAGAAQAYADDVMRRLRDEDIAPDLRLTVSAGIATHGPDADTVHLLMRAADAALYRAKHAGRDRAVVALRDAA